MVLNAKFPAPNVLKSQILTDFIAKLWGLKDLGDYGDFKVFMQRNFTAMFYDLSVKIT